MRRPGCSVGLGPPGQARADMAADDSAEGEAGEMKPRRRWQHDVEAGGDFVSEAIDGEGQGGLVGIAHAGDVAGDHHMPYRQRLDVADPMRPGAEADRKSTRLNSSH